MPKTCFKIYLALEYLKCQMNIIYMKGCEDMNRLIPSTIRSTFFDDDFDSFFFPSVTNVRRNDMKCDIYEKDNNYHIEMDIPGFSKEDVKIEVDNDRLTIKASKSSESNDEDKNYIKRERSYGEYQRSFSLGDIDTDNIDATFEKGMLLITLPKKAAEDSKKTIEIK